MRLCTTTEHTSETSRPYSRHPAPIQHWLDTGRGPEVQGWQVHVNGCASAMAVLCVQVHQCLHDRHDVTTTSHARVTQLAHHQHTTTKHSSCAIAVPAIQNPGLPQGWLGHSSTLSALGQPQDAAEGQQLPPSHTIQGRASDVFMPSLCSHSPSSPSQHRTQAAQQLQGIRQPANMRPAQHSTLSTHQHTHPTPHLHC